MLLKNEFEIYNVMSTFLTNVMSKTNLFDIFGQQNFIELIVIPNINHLTLFFSPISSFFLALTFFFTYKFH